MRNITPPYETKRDDKRQDEVVATAWERFWADGMSSPDEIYPNSQRIVRIIRKEQSPQPILEVGAGSGRDSVTLAADGVSIIILDISASSLKMAGLVAERNGVRISVVRADARALPFRNKTIGTVFHQGVLEHFESPDRVLEENRRVLKNDGHLLVDVPQTFHPWTVLKHILIPFGLWFGGPETQFSPLQLKRMVEKKGFSIRSVYGEWMHPSLMYRLIRELGKKTGIWRLPLYPKIPSCITFWRRVDTALFRGKLECWTGYVVGVLAVKSERGTAGLSHVSDTGIASHHDIGTDT